MKHTSRTPAGETKACFSCLFKIRNPIRNPELELDPNPRSGAPKNRIFEKLTYDA